MSGRRLLELRDCGEARPFVLGHAAHQLATDARECVTTEAGRARVGLNRTELELIAWIAAVEVGFKMPGLAATQAGLAELLRVSKRTVGTMTRRLAAMGLLDVLVQHRPRDGHVCEGRQCRKGRHVRLWNVYALSPHVRELVAAERYAKRGGHRPPAEAATGAMVASVLRSLKGGGERADLQAWITGGRAGLRALRSGNKIQPEESQLPNGSCDQVSPVGEQVDRAPEGAVSAIGAENALAVVRREQESEQRRFRAALQAEFAARLAAVDATVHERVARAIAGAAGGDQVPLFGAELVAGERAELVRRGVARDPADAAALCAMVDDAPIVPCKPALARSGLCCPVHAVRAALRGDS